MAELSRIAARTAAEICGRFELSAEAKALLDDRQTPGQFVERLLAKGRWEDAVRLLAYGLPAREATWWACLCAKAWFTASAPKDEIKAALQAAAKWVNEPTEENRRAALERAQKAEFGNPAGCAAAAAFFSEGSIGAPNGPEVPPPDGAAAKLVAGAVMLAAVSSEPEKAPEKYRAFLDLGVQVARGINRWPSGK